MTSPQKSQVTPRDFDAVCDLACDGLQTVFYKFQILHFKSGGVADALVQELDKSGNDRERAVDIMDDTGVNLAAGVCHLLLDFLILELTEQGLELLGVIVDLPLEGAPLHCVGN